MDPGRGVDRLTWVKLWMPRHALGVPRDVPPAVYEADLVEFLDSPSVGEGGKRVSSLADFQGGRCWRVEWAGRVARAGWRRKFSGSWLPRETGQTVVAPPGTHVVGSLKGEAARPAAYSATSAWGSWAQPTMKKPVAWPRVW